MLASHLVVALRARRVAIVAAPLVVAAGLGARAALTGLVAKIAGDALYTVLVYLLALAVRPELTPRRAFAIALGVSFAVEVAQLTPYPAWLSSKHVLLRLIFGATFGFVDFAGYTVGGVLAVTVHARRDPILVRPDPIAVRPDPILVRRDPMRVRCAAVRLRPHPLPVRPSSRPGRGAPVAVRPARVSCRPSATRWRPPR